MGRPPLNLRNFNVRLKQGTAERIDRLVGNYGRTAFVREAVEEKLDREERKLRDDQGVDPQARPADA